MRSAAKQLIVDPTFYPETDDMGVGELQQLMREMLRPMLARFLAERGIVAHVGSNQFIYWQQFAPTRSIAPDIYVLPGVPQSRVEKIWKLWEESVVPSFCLEIASNDFHTDYVAIPNACDEIGVSELIVYDPEPGGDDERITWQVFRRGSKRARLEQVLRTDAASVRSTQLGCWLTVVGKGDERRLRVARDAAGRDLYPTAAEVAAAARDAENAARDALRRETATRESLEVEVERLRAELAVAQGRKRKPTRR
ncbi:MAG: Uma2 family endonuclease [Labilithrix sp.]|nr:Uma2 family endonuclease [Labilithrix sp.]MCW5810720.1 Uma2 family endonuclease [Labilithrix sp.]